jgi:hypothetical protein
MQQQPRPLDPQLETTPQALPHEEPQPESSQTRRKAAAQLDGLPAKARRGQPARGWPNPGGDRESGKGGRGSGLERMDGVGTL